jgi:hypothetical protein
MMTIVGRFGWGQRTGALVALDPLVSVEQRHMEGGTLIKRNVEECGTSTPCVEYTPE